MVQNSKVQVQLRSPPREAKKRIRSPSPARSPWHAANNAKRPARPTNQYGTQSGGIQQSACAAIYIELTQDLMDAFDIISNVFGDSALGQASMKAMQCLPLAWACLAIIEAGKKAKDVRYREASRSYQEVALPGFIKLCHEAIEASSSIIHCCSCCCHSNLF